MTITTPAVDLNSQLLSQSIASQGSTSAAQNAGNNKVQAQEDSVTLSPTAQKALTYPPSAPPATQPTLAQIIKQAADGDLRALAQLALV